MKILEHGIIYSNPASDFGYVGWPSVALMEDGTLVAVASGGRYDHVCPWGRTLLWKSKDNGKTWAPPLVINNGPLDDRDAGVIALSGNRVAVTWFVSNTLHYMPQLRVNGRFTPDMLKRAEDIVANWTPEMISRNLGSYVRVSDAGAEYFGELLPAPVSSPHGFTVLKDGSWLYLGKRWDDTRNPNMHTSFYNDIVAARSNDEGRSWTLLGHVPFPDGLTMNSMHEPHVVQLPDGRLLGAIRNQGEYQGLRFSVVFTESNDGGKTWSVARGINLAGSPPHLLLHSSGKLICSVGYRSAPYGERVAISNDLGNTWDTNIVLRDDGPTSDLGYPCSVELPDTSVFTLYYQQLNPGEKTSLLYTRWLVDSE